MMRLTIYLQIKSSHRGHRYQGVQIMIIQDKKFWKGIEFLPQT